MARCAPLLIATLFVLSVVAWGVVRAAPDCTAQQCVYAPMIRAGGAEVVTPTSMITPTATQVPVTLFTNGDFEQGAVYWQPQASANNIIITNPPVPVVPHSGIHVAQLTATQDGLYAIIDAVNVTIPVDKPFLNYWVWIRSTESLCGDDVGGVSVDPNVIDTFDLCAGRQTNGWVNRELDLTAYAGRSGVVVELAAGTFDIDAPDSFLYIDDIGWKAAPVLPPPSYNNCQADPNSSAAPNYPVQIVEINKVAETVTLKNVGTTIVDLTDWHMCSITGNQQHPISGTLAPGASQTFPGPSGSIWNNSSPDPGALYNPAGQLVSYFNS